MSYRCCIFDPLASMIGVEPGGPWVKCDSCGVRITIKRDRMPPKWLLDGRSAPGWRVIKHEDGTRTDTCKACR